MLVALLATACVAPNEACTPTALGAIEEGFVSEVFLACHSFRGDPHWREECPEYPIIQAKYRKQREAWVRCSN